jgi:uncharacterized protein (TIGR00304 family)
MVGSPPLRAVGALLITGGALLLLWALATGQASIALVVIIPIIYGTGPLVALSILMVFAGIVLVFMSMVVAGPPDEGTGEGASHQGEDRTEVRREWGGVVLLGPVPIVFGSAGALKDRRVLMALSVMSLIILVLFILAIL